MLQLLSLAGDGKEHVLADARGRLGAELNLTPTEQDELLPSGGLTRFANRVTRARVYLERGGLLEWPSRFIISPRGREALSAQPTRIDVKRLAEYPEFREFQKVKRPSEEPTTHLTTTQVANAETPEEVVVSASWWICF
jgi:restriction endonuclease Mrr